MREIKFNYWDRKEKVMYRNSSNLAICSNGGVSELIHHEEYLEWVGTDYKKHIIPLQYTGLKDRSGTEIYEGDILEFINEDSERTIAICKFGNRRLVTDRGITIDIQCFYFEVKGWKTNPVVSNYKGVHDLEIMEVRGNIYENPELIS